MKRSIRSIMLLGLVLLVLACASSPIVEPDVEHSLTILHTNDHHGHPVAFFDYPAPNQGGLPAQASFVAEVRDESANLLVLSAGDFNTGRPESNFFKAEPDIIGFNYIGYDAMAMGNHEFDPSPAEMQEQIALSEFPWLCANVVYADSGEYIDNVAPYIIKDYGSFKVGIIGLLSTETAKTGNPENIKGLTFLDEVETANMLVPKLKKQADIVIAVVHMGIYDEDNKGSKRVAAEVPGLALVIDGHTHTKVEEPVMITNRVSGEAVPILQAKHWGLYVGKIDLRFMNGTVTDMDYELVPINVRTRQEAADGTRTYPTLGKEYAPDSQLEALLASYVEQVDAVLAEEIGEATAPFLNADTRKRETAIGDMVADSMLWFANEMNLGVDFAFQNGGGIRTDIPDGPITKGTIYEVLPFDNSVAVVTMKGSDIIRLFESTPANVGHGAMPQVSEGVSFTIDTAAGTIADLRVGGKPVDPAAEYVIATNSYLAAGGDGYAVFTEALDYYDTSLMQRDAFIEYVLHLGGSITPEVQNRIKLQ